MEPTPLLARAWPRVAQRLRRESAFLVGPVELVSGQLLRPVTGKSDVKAVHNDFLNGSSITLRGQRS
jgi:hypothetical protein